MHSPRQEQINDAFGAGEREPLFGQGLDTDVTAVAERLRDALGPFRSRIEAIEPTDQFLLSNPNPSCREIAAGVMVRLNDGAAYELVISEYRGMKSLSITEDNGFYISASEPRYGMSLKGHRKVEAVDLPDAEQQFIEIVRSRLETHNQ